MPPTEAVELLDLGLERMPTSQVRFTDTNTYPFLEAYYAASAMGDKEAAAKEAAEASLVEANAKITEMQNAAAVAELNAALAPYTEEQRAVAKEDIDAFNSNPGSVEINSIVGKICTAMVQAARESQIAETNAASQIDVFGMTDDAGKKENTDPADVDVF